MVAHWADELRVVLSSCFAYMVSSDVMAINCAWDISNDLAMSTALSKV